jgi:RNA polymerase sigma-70 factor (ECF subfamily)
MRTGVTSTEPAGSDEALIELARAGNSRAFRMLVQRHLPAVFGLGSRWSGSLEIGGSVAMVVFNQAYGSYIEGVDRERNDDLALGSRGAFSSHLYRSTAEALLKIGAVSYQDVEADQRPNGQLQEALSAIDDQFRMIVLLRDMCGLPLRDLVEVLGLTSGAVRSRLSRARVALSREVSLRASLTDVL